MTTPSDAPTRRDRFDLLALLVGVGALVAVIGAGVSAEGAPEIGVIDGWSQVDLFSAEIASFGFVALVGGAALLLVAPRLDGTPSPASHPNISASAFIIVLSDLAVLVGAALAGVVAVLERKSEAPDGSRPLTEYYTDSEKVGEIVEYAGIVLIALVVGWYAVRAARTARSPSRE